MKVRVRVAVVLLMDSLVLMLCLCCWRGGLMNHPGIEISLDACLVNRVVASR